MVATLFAPFSLLFPLNPRNHQKSPISSKNRAILSIDDSCKFIDDSCTKHWRFMYLLTKAEIVNKFTEKCLGRISCSVTFVENKKTNYDENNHHIQPDDCLPEPESFCKKCGGIFGSSEYYTTNQPIHLLYSESDFIRWGDMPAGCVACDASCRFVSIYNKMITTQKTEWKWKDWLWCWWYSSQWAGPRK